MKTKQHYRINLLILISFFGIIYITNAQNIDDALIIKTKYGLVKGKTDKNNTIVWKGIPYAKPPVGDLRWKAPREPEVWEGIYNATKFSKPGFQYHPMRKQKIFGDEDCLYLNIWKPAKHNEKLPVYVWIHGGGNTLGHGDQLSEYYGHEIAQRSQVIFVSINYRLGIFGWLSHPSLRNSDNSADNSGNYGTLDIIQSLKWIQENIESFGGDPERVLISGESAGGINILSLMISPKAKGLFSAALCQSGIPRTGKITDSEKLTEEIILSLLQKNKEVKTKEEAKKRFSTMNNKQINDFLYKQKAKDIQKCLSPFLLGMIDMPFIFPDGYVIPKKGYDVLSSGGYTNNVPLMIGSNSNETKLFIYFSKRPKPKEEIYYKTAKYTSDMWKAVGVDYIARKLSNKKSQAPVYAYLFNFGNQEEKKNSPMWGKWGKKLGAHHMSEIKFFLGTDKRRAGILSLTNKNKYKKGRAELSNLMMGYAKNFLYTGDPNHKGLPEWKAWSNVSDFKGIILDAGKDQVIIKDLKQEFFSDSIRADMKKQLSKEEIEAVNSFMFIFK